MSETADNSDLEPLSFEQALERLESIVRELEDGQSGLADSLQQYEEGVRLLKHCHATLSQVERRVSLLTGVEPDGTAVIESFSEEAMTLEEKQESRSRRRSRPAKGSSERLPKTADPAASDPQAEEDSESDMDIQRGLF